MRGGWVNAAERHWGYGDWDAMERFVMAKVHVPVSLFMCGLSWLLLCDARDCTYVDSVTI